MILNVKTYGALGDGIHEDAPAINACLAAAAAQGSDVYFPSGIYLCNKHTDQNILQYNASGHSNITISGTDATILTTIDAPMTQLYIYAFAKCYNLSIKGITFSNTHSPSVVGQTVASYVTGTGNNFISGLSWYNCTFSGFSNALILQGINGLRIKNNSFVSPAGHNNAQPNNNPAVYVNLADNQNGQVYNAVIEGNYASGYTGSMPITVPRPMDGFIYGFSYGGVCQNNHTEMFSQEHYYIQNPTTNPSTNSAFIFQNNYLDCSITPGWIDDGNVPHKYNYGFRTEASHVVVRDNYFLNYTNGIMIRGIDFPAAPCQDYFITGNILVAGADPSLYTPAKAVFIQGSSGLPISGVNIQGNRITGDGPAAMQILNTTWPVSANNTFIP